MEPPAKKRLKTSLRSFLDKPRKSMEELVDFLESGGDVNIVHRNTTLLCEASRHGNVEGVNYLLENGADVDLCDDVQSSPLYLAASHGEFDILEKLVGAGAALDQRNKNGYTALISAIQHGHDKCAMCLIDAGADVNVLQPNTIDVEVPLMSYVIFAKGDVSLADKLLKAGTLPHTFLQPLGYFLLEDKHFPLKYLECLIAAGFELYSETWMNMMKRRDDKTMTADRRSLLELLDNEHKNARSLQSLCRISVRKLLILNSTKIHLLKKTELLPIPTEVKKFLALEYI